MVHHRLLRLGSFVAIQIYLNFPNPSYFIEQIFVGYRLQCEMFCYESLLADLVILIYAVVNVKKRE